MLFNRRYPPHHPMVDQDYRSNILLLTLCTKHRQPVRANRFVEELLLKGWLPSENWTVGKYVVLPDHIHLFCTPTLGGRSRLACWVASWKSFVTKNWRDSPVRPLWQRSFWDRQMRSGEDYSSRCSYILQNPVRHHLVQNSEEWPFQGEVHNIVWHDRR